MGSPRIRLTLRVNHQGACLNLVALTVPVARKHAGIPGPVERVGNRCIGCWDDIPLFAVSIRALTIERKKAVFCCALVIDHQNPFGRAHEKTALM